MKITEPERELDVPASYDVVVAGGGVAGVAAAMAAAREGASVCLLEREYLLGGLATGGLVAIYLPICDGRGHQLIGGITEELLRASLKYGTGEIPACWRDEASVGERSRQRYKVYFDPTSFAYALDRKVGSLGIDVMFGTSFSNVLTSDGRITHVVVENREGRCAIKARSVIDATGDACVCAAAGEKTELFDDNRMAGWYYLFREQEGLSLRIVADPLTGPVKAGERTYGGIACRDVTEFVIRSRARAFDDRSQSYPGGTVAQLPTIPEIRMTRRLAGAYELAGSDERKTFGDAVGLFGDWRKAGPVFELPYSALHGRCKNLLVAGRCISSGGDAWDVTRAIPVCALSGEAVGTAAAMACAADAVDITALDARTLRNRLVRNGNIFDEGLIA